MRALWFLPSVFFVSSFAPAQAPIERRASTVPSAPLSAAPVPPRGAMFAWPDAGTVARGTTVLVRSSDSVNPHICKVDFIDSFRVACVHTPEQPEYERAFIHSIQVAPRGYAPLSGLKMATFVSGGLGILLGGACGADGGPVCAEPEYIGLALLATGVVLHFTQLHLRHKDRKMLYEAPEPVARLCRLPFGIRMQCGYP